MSLPRTALAALLIFSGAVHAEIRPEFDDGGLYFQTASGIAPATRLASDFDIAVTGIVANVSVSQRFRNTGSEWVEGIYVFPLPDDAAVNRLTMQIGERRIEGEIQEREQAKRIYEQAREAGQQASLVEQERPNLFTTSVANVAPGQEITIEIGYLQTATFDAGRFELRVPMTLTPRYVPPGVSDAGRISPPVRTGEASDSHRATVGVSIDAGLPIAEAGSASHELTSAWDGRVYRLATGEGPVPMDRDLVIDWQPVPGQSPGVAAFTETVGRDSFVLLMFVPPSSAAMPEPTPREPIFVIDTSGSMGGSSIEQAKAGLTSALERLGPGDRFNVIEFNSDARSLFPSPVAASPTALADARRFVDDLSADGGTNIRAALDAALAQPVSYGSLRQIVFITDGSVGNEAEIFDRIRHGLGQARLFTVGIGAAPNTHFMRKAAEFGRGSYSHIASPEDVQPRMQRLFTRLEHVAVTDIEIAWPWSVEAYPERIPDLYVGEPVVVAARLGPALDRELEITATGRVDTWQWTERLTVIPSDAGGVASVWARRKIESLLDQRLDGTNPDEIRENVVGVALEHGMLSPFTSLVAVDRTPSLTRTARLRREALGNLLPAGSQIGARLAGLPATATNSGLYQLIGTVLTALCLGLIGIAWLRRKA